MRKSILYILLSIVFTSSILAQSTFISQIPAKDNYNFIFFNYTNDLRKKLHVKNLENGSDFLKIRIWINGGYGLQEMYQISETNKGWKAAYYSFRTKPSKKDFLADVVTKRHSKIKFRSNPDSLVQQLHSSGIDTLHAIDNYAIQDYVADGVTYCFEYSSKTKYNFYISSNPKDYSFKYPQAKLSWQIVELLNNEFDFKGNRERLSAK